MTLIDIIQLYNINNDIDVSDMSTFYNDIVIDSRIDKDILIGALLDECGAMDSVYNTVATFKYFSNNFFKKYEKNIIKLLDTLEGNYDALKNKNIEWTETTQIEQNLDTAEDTSENRTKTNTGTQTTNDTGTRTNEYEEDETNTISAMNSSSYEPDNKSEKDGSNTRTDNLQSQRTDNLSEGIIATNGREKNEALTWDETDTHTEGGIENMPYQDLIEKERKVWQFSIYNWISKKYAKELFLLVY